MSVDKARDMFEATNKAANEYFTSVYELNVKLVQDVMALWSKKNDDVSKD
jgi:ribosomal protein S17E